MILNIENIGMKRILMVNCCISFCIALAAQKQKTYSLAAKYAKEKTDTGKVKLLWQMADAAYVYNPDSAIFLGQQALHLAQKIKYKEGESRSLGVLATSFTRISNYPKALNFYFDKLKLDETEKYPRNLASTYINIGVLYIYLQEYENALTYYRKADSLIRIFDIKELEYYASNNLGDVYERLNTNDSALMFFSKALAIAVKMDDKDLTGASMVGMGHVYSKENNLNLSLQYYLQALHYLEISDDDDLSCEALLGIANLYGKKNDGDSAKLYALKAYQLAKNDGFQSRQLDAASFLTKYYKNAGDVQNAFIFLEAVESLKDSIFSSEKIRQSQVILSNEQLRQNEIAESKRLAEEDRRQQMQFLLIGIFIPLFFLVTVLLSRVRIHHHIIRYLGIISLLMVSEYLLLFLNPRVAKFTNHTPVYEMMIFVLISLILVPSHNRIEHWFLTKLARNKAAHRLKPSEVVAEKKE